MSEEVTVEDNLDEYPSFEKFKLDILIEAANLYNINSIEDFKKHINEKFVPSKIGNLKEDIFIIGTSADDISIFISTYILVTNRGNRDFIKSENEKSDTLDKFSNEEALLKKLKSESLRYKMQLLEINNQDRFGAPERGYQIGTIFGYEKAIFNLKKF